MNRPMRHFDKQPWWRRRFLFAPLGGWLLGLLLGFLAALAWLLQEEDDDELQDEQAIEIPLRQPLAASQPATSLDLHAGSPANAHEAAQGAAATDTLKAEASISDDNPETGSEITLTVRLTEAGKPIAGAQMVATWNYKTVKPTCAADTDAEGVATCVRRIGKATEGQSVRVDVQLTTSDGRTAATSVSFNPR